MNSSENAQKTNSKSVSKKKTFQYWKCPQSYPTPSQNDLVHLKECRKAWVWVYTNGQSPKQIQPHKNLTKVSTFAKCKSLMSGKLTTDPSHPRAFHKEPFATHPWISWWLGCMRALAMRLNPLHFLRPGWLKGNVNSALFPKEILLTPNYPPAMEC